MALGKGKFDQINLKSSGLAILCVYEKKRTFRTIITRTEPYGIGQG